VLGIFSLAVDLPQTQKPVTPPSLHAFIPWHTTTPVRMNVMARTILGIYIVLIHIALSAPVLVAQAHTRTDNMG
jgi:hypothetical protein